MMDLPLKRGGKKRTTGTPWHSHCKEEGDERVVMKNPKKIQTLATAMRKKIFYFLTGITLALGVISADAESATVATVPEGMITFSLPQGATTYLSLPVTSNVTYAGSVTAVTTNSISVGDTPAPFTTNLATATAPYFVKFLSGNEMGRTVLIEANTTSSLTLDTTDNSSQTVNLTTSGFNVQVGDTFEIFPANTLTTLFGNNTTQNPLLLQGSKNIFTADTVSIYSPALASWQAYYFNTKNGYWELNGSSANTNNLILYPYRSLTVTRRTNETSTSLVIAGRVAEVSILTKTTGSNAVVYGSTNYPTNMTLSQLKLGSNWMHGTSVFTADTISVWNSSLGSFESYYQMPDSTWRQSNNASVDQSSLVIPSGTCVAILQRATVSGATSYLSSVLPYSLN
jgi:uncharacterized protein (TIGR02597 family)